MHRDGNADEACLSGRSGGEGFDREVNGVRREARLCQYREGGGKGEGLVAEFVAGEEED